MAGSRRLELGEDVAAFPKGDQRLRTLALLGEHHPDTPMRDREIALPLGVFRRGLGEAFSDGERGLVGGERVGEIALANEHVAHLVV